MVLVSKMKFVS